MGGKWKRYLRPELIFNFSLIGYSLFFIINSLQYFERNRVFPLWLGFICLALSAAYLVIYMKKAKAWSDEEVAAYKVNWRPLAVSAILALFYVGIYYLGILVACSVFTVLFIYFWGRQKLWIALVSAGITIFVIQVIFVKVMKMYLYNGVLFH